MSTAPQVGVEPAPLEAILGMREEYRREMACQVVHDSWHARGFTASYLLRLDGQVSGYGSVGGAPRDPKDTVKEFFVAAPHRGATLPLFRELVAASGARAVEAQTNDRLLWRMLLACAADLSSETILFADGPATRHAPPGAVFRALTEAERRDAFPHTHEPVGEYGVVCEGRVAATGGLAFHYNPPYADLFMEVDEPYRRRGLGSYLVQELRRVAREGGCIPAARCHQDNAASQRTLRSAGMVPCGRIVRGVITDGHRGAGPSPTGDPPG